MQLISPIKSVRIFFKSFRLTFKDMSLLFLLIAGLAGIGFELAHVWFTGLPHGVVYDFIQAFFTLIALCYAYLRFSGHEPNIKPALSYLSTNYLRLIVPFIAMGIYNSFTWQFTELTINSMSWSTEGCQAFVLYVLVGFGHMFLCYLLALSVFKSGYFFSILRQWIISVPKIVFAAISFVILQFLGALMIMNIALIFGYIMVFALSLAAPAVAKLSIINFINTLVSVFTTAIINAVAGYFAATLAWNESCDHLANDYER